MTKTKKPPKETISFKVLKQHRAPINAMVRKFLKEQGYKLYNKDGKKIKRKKNPSAQFI